MKINRLSFVLALISAWCVGASITGLLLHSTGTWAWCGMAAVIVAIVAWVLSLILDTEE